MKQLKEILEDKNIKTPMCPKCGDRQGYIVLEEGISIFRCVACKYECKMKHYRDLLKEYHQAHKDDLEVVEIDVERI